MSAFARTGSLTRLSVSPIAWRWSNTGTPAARNDAVLCTGRSGTVVTLNGTTVGEWLWMTAFTSGRAR